MLSVTMVRAVLFFVGLVAAAAAQLTEETYGVYTTMLSAPIRAARAHQPGHDQAFHSNAVEDSESGLPAVEPAATAANDTAADSEESRGRQEDNAIQDGVRKMRELYNGCNKKINKRINHLLKSMDLKSGTQKDLFELKEYILSLVSCLKVSGFRYLDGVLSGDVIPVTDYVELVRDRRSLLDSPIVKVGPSALNGKLSPPRDDGSAQGVGQYAESILQGSLSDLMVQRLGRLLNSHSLKFHVDPTEVEGRGRRRDHRMFTMMVMGFMIMSTILIPMGFQFLTVLGGKSLLMAKMALVMSAINGLKKIATSHVGYGFYHTAPDGYHHPHHHDFHEKVFQVKPDQSPSPLPFNLAL